MDFRKARLSSRLPITRRRRNDVRVQKYHKEIGNKEAVKELTLKLKKGTIYGLLGENGSGKTTLMKMAAGLTQPTEGEILFEGHPLSYQDKASIAYMSPNHFSIVI